MDGTFDELLVFAAKQVNGRQKRSIFAAVCEKLCDGSSRKTEERFGWSREAVAKGLLERSVEPEEEVRFQRGGVKPSEVRNPQLAIDIRLIVEPHTHSDPELKSNRLYTNFSAAEVRSALSNMGYTEDRLPSERTLRDILNRMNYRLKRIQKGKPLKKTENTTPIFENLNAARNEAKAESTTLEISVDTKSKVSLGEYVLGGKNQNRQPR
jgi:hypothetical protein